MIDKWSELTNKEKNQLVLEHVMGCFIFESMEAFIECAKQDYQVLPQGFHWPAAYWDDRVECWIKQDRAHGQDSLSQVFDPLRDMNDAWQVIEKVLERCTTWIGPTYKAASRMHLLLLHRMQDLTIRNYTRDDYGFNGWSMDASCWHVETEYEEHPRLFLADTPQEAICLAALACGLEEV